jgi:hypothetical protein
MVSRNHNNRSEKQKGHVPDSSARGDDGSSHSTDAGPKSRGDGGGGAPRQQGQAQANKDDAGSNQNRGHGGHK